MPISVPPALVSLTAPATVEAFKGSVNSTRIVGCKGISRTVLLKAVAFIDIVLTAVGFAVGGGGGGEDLLVHEISINNCREKMIC